MNKNKILMIVSIIGMVLVTIGVTYAFFSARISGIESASTLSVTAGTLGITYTEGNGDITINNAYPRIDPWITKQFTITGSNTTGGVVMNYELGLNITANTFLIII